MPSIGWCLAVAHLMERRGVALNNLLRFKYQLAKALARKIEACRKATLAAGCQRLLFGPESRAETSFDDGFDFAKRAYPARFRYQGRYVFARHFNSPPGELQSSGEEFACAQVIDTLPAVKHWIRNLRDTSCPRSGCKPRPTASIPTSWPNFATAKFW